MHAAASRFVPNRRDVAHEAFDGEVILIHFPTGRYFRLDEPGRVGWSAIERGATHEDVAGAFRQAFEVGEADAVVSARAFLASLAGFGLVVEGHVPADAPPPAAERPVTRRAFVEPRVETFSDLQDLFLVDPIHDVDEAGWPHAKP
jgi:hypothetical protein